MQQFNAKNILLGILVVLVLGGGIFLYWLGTLPEPKQEVQNTAPQKEEVYTLVARVSSIDEGGGAFVVKTQDEQEFKIVPGARTELTRTIFPFDIKNPPKEATFVPERKSIKMSDLEEGVQLFIRSSHAIVAGKDIVNPLQVEWLP